MADRINQRVLSKNISITSEGAIGMVWLALSEPSNATDPSGVLIVFVLKKEGISSFEEITKTPLIEYDLSKRATPDGVESESSDRFSFYLFHHGSSIGRDRYSFVKRSGIWRLAEIRNESLSLVEENGDEAVGDTRTEMTVNYLTGWCSRDEYKGNKFIKTIKKKIHLPIIYLSGFTFDKIVHDYC